MRQHVRVAVTQKAPVVRDLHAAQNQLSARGERVAVKSLAHGIAGRKIGGKGEFSVFRPSGAETGRTAERRVYGGIVCIFPLCQAICAAQVFRVKALRGLHGKEGFSV